LEKTVPLALNPVPLENMHEEHGDLWMHIGKD